MGASPSNSGDDEQQPRTRKMFSFSASYSTSEDTFAPPRFVDLGCFPCVTPIEFKFPALRRYSHVGCPYSVQDSPVIRTSPRSQWVVRRQFTIYTANYISNVFIIHGQCTLGSWPRCAGASTDFINTKIRFPEGPRTSLVITIRRSPAEPSDIRENPRGLLRFVDDSASNTRKYFRTSLYLRSAIEGYTGPRIAEEDRGGVEYIFPDDRYKNGKCKIYVRYSTGTVAYLGEK